MGKISQTQLVKGKVDLNKELLLNEDNLHIIKIILNLKNTHPKKIPLLVKFLEMSNSLNIEIVESILNYYISNKKYDNGIESLLKHEDFIKNFSKLFKDKISFLNKIEKEQIKKQFLY